MLFDNTVTFIIFELSSSLNNIKIILYELISKILKSLLWKHTHFNAESSLADKHPIGWELQNSYKHTFFWPKF